jgi:Ca2+-binding RTX toxin-like protein
MQGGGGHNLLWGQGDWATDPSFSHRPSTDDNAADTFVTGQGSNTMYGQGGNDIFHLNSNPTILTSYDYAYGAAGNDTFHINGTRGGLLVGDTGGDTFKVYNPSAAFQLFGGSHTDTVDFSPLNVQIYATNDPTKLSGAFWGADGQRKLKIFSDNETLIGTNLRDSLSSTNGAGNLFGRGGNDALYGNGGNDFIDGGDGDDSIWAGNDNDTVFAGKGNDTVWAGSGNDIVFGGDGNDVLYGENGNDQLYGEAGGDHLHGQGGSNKLVGGSGSDYLVSKNGSWYDLVIGGNENGSGNTGAFDIAVVDRIFHQGVFKYDTFIGIESVSF